MILFLDFDGVTHPALGQTNFNLLPLLESWLREHPDVNVVISSSWREVMDLEVLQHIFSEDLHQRIIDKCPMITNDHVFCRYEEILAWITHANYEGLWLALDDAAHEFPKNFNLLIVCQNNIGINVQVINALNEKYELLTRG
jgi:hypothetical protein